MSNLKFDLQHLDSMRARILDEYNPAIINLIARRDELLAPIEKSTKKIINKWGRIAQKLSEHRNYCRCCGGPHWRAYSYSDYSLKSDFSGIALRYDADHPNDIIDEEYTWAELEEFEKNNPSLCNKDED